MHLILLLFLYLFLLLYLLYLCSAERFARCSACRFGLGYNSTLNDMIAEPSCRAPAPKRRRRIVTSYQKGAALFVIALGVSTLWQGVRYFLVMVKLVA